MESRVPLPTDNIYKFYALFGLLIVVFSLGSMIYINKSTNSLVFQVWSELSLLDDSSIKSPSEKEKVKMLERKVEVAVQDKSTFQYVLIVLMTVGGLLLIYGFGKWHQEVQPIQDEMARLTVEKLRYEVEQIRQLGEGENR